MLLPASAECPVQLHETLVLGAARLREREFSGKERPLAVQDFEISSGASLVAHGGQVDGLLQVRYGILLANPDLMDRALSALKPYYSAGRLKSDEAKPVLSQRTRWLALAESDRPSPALST